MCVSAFVGSSNLTPPQDCYKGGLLRPLDQKHSTESKAPIRICRILGFFRLQIAIWTRRVRQSKMFEYPRWVFDLYPQIPFSSGDPLHMCCGLCLFVRKFAQRLEVAHFFEPYRCTINVTEPSSPHPTLWSMWLGPKEGHDISSMITSWSRRAFRTIQASKHLLSHCNFMQLPSNLIWWGWLEVSYYRLQIIDAKNQFNKLSEVQCSISIGIHIVLRAMCFCTSQGPTFVLESWQELIFQKLMCLRGCLFFSWLPHTYYYVCVGISKTPGPPLVGAWMWLFKSVGMCPNSSQLLDSGEFSRL